MLSPSFACQGGIACTTLEEAKVGQPKLYTTYLESSATILCLSSLNLFAYRSKIADDAQKDNCAVFIQTQKLAICVTLQ